MPKLEIFCDNYIEGAWFQELSPQLASARFRTIGLRGTNPRVIEELIAYDRPDIILLSDGRPVLVLEKTREVPTGHNVGQRFARIVRAAELAVPVIKFFPFDAMKHGQYAGVCNLNVRLLKAFDRMGTIHDVPVLAVNWPVDTDFELCSDGSENEVISRLIRSYVSSNFDPHIPEFAKQRAYMQDELQARLERRQAYDKPPPSVEIVPTERLLATDGSYLSGRVDGAFLAREETLVYRMGMTEAKCRREDPYTGTQYIYDYNWCRTGESPSSKSRNLVLHFPKIRYAVWQAKNPNNPQRKSSNWYLTANALLFSDDAEVLR